MSQHNNWWSNSKLFGKPSRNQRRAQAKPKPAALRVMELEDRVTPALFGTATAYPVGMGPMSVTSGDFNNDTILDLVTANVTGQSISFLSGKAGGQFNAATTPVTTTATPFAVVAADLDGNSNLDLASVFQGSDQLFSLKGLGDGNFGFTDIQNVGTTPYAVRAADLNGDAKLDLVTANLTGNSVTVLLNDGTGHFPSPVSVTMPGTNPGPTGVAVADFTGDGKPDLAVANNTTGDVVILANNGSGAFSYSSTIAAPAGYSNPFDVIAGDFDGVGRPDLAVSYQGSTANTNNSVFVFTANGSGTFTTRGPFATGAANANPTRLAAGDFNLDGKQDLVAANDDGSAAAGNLGVLLGNGDGTFQAYQTFATGGRGAVAPVVGDFNADGKPDVAVANRGGQNVGVLLNTYVPPPVTLAATLTNGTLTVADTAGAANNLTVRVSNGNLVVSDTAGTFTGGSGSYSTPLAGVTAVSISGGGGNDTLTVDLSAGDAVPSGGIAFDGGAGGFDSLVVSGGSQGTVTYNYTNASDGSVAMSNFGTISYVGLEPIANTGDAADVVFNLPTATANAATLANSGTGLLLSGATFEDTTFANPTNSLTVNRGQAGDTLTLGSPVSNLATTAYLGAYDQPFNRLTVSGDVNVGSKVFLAYGNEILVNGAITAGGVTLDADTGAVASGHGTGVAVNRNVTASSVIITGRGGDLGGGNNVGVLVAAGVTVSGSPGVGGVTVTGYGGTNADFNSGVAVKGTITSSFGAVTVTGTGGTGTTDNYGVLVSAGGTITSGSTGGTSVTGTGGGAGNSNIGVYVTGSGSGIKSANGSAVVNGTGSGAAGTIGNYGVLVEGGAVVRAGGLGGTSVIGTGGAGATLNNGVIVTGSGSAITSNAGPVFVYATGRSNSEAVRIQSGGSIGTGSNAALDIAADSLVIVSGNGTINAGTGTATVEPRTAGTLVSLGGADVLTGSPLTLGLDATELAQVTAGTIQVGSATAGAVATAATISTAANLTLTSGSTVTVTNPVTVAAGKTLTATATGLVSVTGAAVTASGAGGVSLTSANVGVKIAGGGSVTTAAGPITLSGNATDATGGFGVQVTGSGSVVQSSTGNITLTGMARGTNVNDEAAVGADSGGQIVGGTAGTVTVVASSFSQRAGFRVYLGSLTASGANIDITGTVTGVPATSDAAGILLQNALSTTGGGTITLNGTLSGTPAAGNGGSGVHVGSGGVSAGTGAVSITGTSTANVSGTGDAHGVLVDGAVTTAGSLSVAGTTVPVTGTGAAFGAYFRAGSTASGAAGTTINADARFTGTGFPNSTAGTLALTGGKTLLVNITGANASDRLVVNGTGGGNVNLAGATLSLNGTYTPASGNVFTIVTATGTISGTFNGLANNATLTYLGRTLRINYSAASVTLTDVTSTLSTNLSGGTLTIADNAGRANAITASVSGSNLVLTDAAETFAPGVGTLSNGGRTLTVPVSSVTSLVINTGTGNDTLTISGPLPVPVSYDGGAAGSDAARFVGTGQTATYTPSAATAGSGTVVFGGGTVTFSNLEPMDFDGVAFVLNTPAGGADVLTVANGFLIDGTTAALKVSGTVGGVAIEDARVRNSSVTIQTNTGADTITVTSANNASGVTGITLDAGQTAGDVVSVTGAVALGAGNFSATAARVSVTAAVSGGAVTLDADGGAQVAGNFIGVDIQANVTGTGAVVVEGRGGDTGASNYGVSVSSGAVLSGGTTTVTGVGGASAGNLNDGVRVGGGGQVSSAAGGAVTVKGTGGAGNSSGNRGVYVTGAGSAITSGTGGNVSVTGDGGGTAAGSGAGNIGVRVVVSGVITSGGAGTVLVTGTGGGGSGASQDGISVDGSSQTTTTAITSGGTGSVTLKGKGGAAALNSRGVVVTTGAVVSSGGGNVDVTGDGGGDGTGSGNYGVYLFSSGVVTSGGAGTVAVTGGGGTGTGGSNDGVNLTTSSQITSGGAGGVTVKGTGGTTAGSGNRGVFVSGSGGTSKITSGGGTVSVDGTGGGGGTGGTNHGVYATGGGQVTSGGTGTVLVKGAGGGGTGGGNLGVLVDTAALILSGGTGGVTVQGVGGGGAAANQRGVVVTDTTSAITSGGGSVTVTGTGGGTDGAAAGGSSYGVFVNGGGTVTSGGSGGVTVNGTGGSGTNGSNHGVYVTGSGSKITAGGTGGVSVTGNGGAGNGGLNYGVLLNTSGTITSNGGNVSVAGNGGTGVSGAGGSNYGVALATAGLITSGGAGTTTVVGAGGVGTGGSNVGVFLADANTKITSGGAGAVTVTGTGANSAGNTNVGVYLLTSAAITSGGAGNVSVTGTGGDGSGSFGLGVFVLNAGSAITSGGGTVTVKGTGGAGAGGGNYGVDVDAGGITSGGGAVDVTGTGGGAGNNNMGVYAVNSGSIKAAADAAVKVTGKGGTTAAGSSNYGVWLLNGGTVTSAGTGTVTVKGDGGAGTAGLHHGVDVEGGGAAITSGGAGTVAVTGTGGASDAGSSFGVLVVTGGATITSGGGNVTVVGNGGTATGSAGNNYGVEVAGAGVITSGGSGAVSVTGGGGTGNGGANYGVYVVNTGSKITSGGAGAVAVTGTGGGGAGDRNVGVVLRTAGQITSGSGNVSVTGSGGAGSGNVNHGLSVDGTITSGGSGTVTVAGTGGTGAGSNNVGVYVDASGTVTSGGAGAVAVTGTGGSGAGVTQHGVLVIGSSATITSGGGNVGVTGFGGGSAASGGSNFGTVVALSGKITSGGGGAVTVQGTGGGGSGGGFNYGVALQSGTATITSGGAGAVAVTGVGGASPTSSNYGVFLGYDAPAITSGGGTVTVTGTGGGGGTGGQNDGVRVDSTGGLITSGGGTVTVAGTGGSGSGGGNTGVTVLGGGSTGGGIAAPAALAVTGTKGANSTYGISVTGAGAAISAVGLATLTGASGADVLVDTTATANFGSLTATTTGNATVFEDSAMSLAGSNVGGTFALGAAGGIAETAAVTAGSLSASNTTSGDINLGTQSNVVTTFAASNTAAGGAVSMKFSTGGTVGTVGSVAGVTTNGGNVTVSNAAGGLTLGANVTTTGPGAAAGNVQLTSTNAIDLAASVTITTDNATGTDGSVTANNSINATAAGQALAVAAGGGAVTLTNVGATKAVQSLSINGGAVTVSSVGAATGGIVLVGTTLALNGSLQADRTANTGAQGATAGAIRVGGAITLGTSLGFDTDAGTTDATITFDPGTSVNGGVFLNPTAGGGDVVLNNATFGQTTPLSNLNITAAAVTGTGSIATTSLLNVNSSAASSLTGVISGSGGLAKSGTGTLTLGGTNTYTGATFVSGGVLSVGVLANGGAASSIGASSNAAANLSLSLAGQLVYTGGSVTTDRGFTTGILNIATAGAVVEFGGVVAGSGTLVKTGSTTSILTLSGANTFTGNVSVDSGGVRATNSGSFGVGPKNVSATGGATNNSHVRLDGSAGAITLPANISFATNNPANQGSIVNEAGANTINGIITAVSGGNTVIAANAGSLTLAGTVRPDAFGNTVQLTGPAVGTVTGPITDNGVLTVVKNGTGTWTLSGTNTYSGTTTVNAGTLQLGSATALGATGTGTTVAAGAVLDLNGQTVGAEPVTLNGTGIASGGALVNSSGTAASLAGAVTLASASSVGGSGNVTLGGAVAGGAFALSTVGAGTRTFNGGVSVASVSTAAGGTTLGANVTTTNGQTYGDTVTLATAATITLSGSSVTFNGNLDGGTKNLTVTGNAAFGDAAADAVTNLGTLQISGTTALTAAALTATAATFTGTATVTGSVTLNVGTLSMSAVTLGTQLTVNNSAAGTVSGAITGTGGAVVKQGAGTLTLTGTSNYTGGTTVSAGRLNVNGSITSAATIGGGILGGTGTVGGITLNSGSVSPGTSPGVFNSGSVTFTGGSFDVEVTGTGTAPVAGTDYDQLNVTGTVALGAGTTALNLSPTTGVTAGATYTIVNNDGTDNVTGFFTGLPEGALVGTFGGTKVYITYAGGSNNNDVQLLTTPTVNGTAGNDQIVLRQKSGSPGQYQISTDNGTTFADLGAITTLTVNGFDGNDVLTLDGVNGNPLPGGGVTFNGGNPTTGPGDKLRAVNGTYTTITSSYTNAHDGTVNFDGRVVTYVGLEPVLLNVGTVQDMIFNLPAAASQAFLEDDGTAANATLQLRSGNGTFETTTFTNPTGSVTINRGNAADTLTVNAVPELTSAVTLAATATPFATVTVAGAVTLAAGKDFRSFGVFTSVNAAVTTSGAGAVALTADQSLAVTANVTGGTGGVTLLGKGTAAVSSTGVTVGGGAVVTATGSGAVSVTGTGGGAADFEHGVQVIGGTITSGGGTVTVVGTAGAGTGSSDPNYGVVVVLGGTITAGGGGTVSVTGTGGTGAGITNHGVVVYGSTISSAGGNVTVNGTSGKGSNNIAVHVDTTGLITAGGAGTVSVTGTNISTAGTNDYGVLLSGSGTISSNAGAVSVTGSGGAGGSGNYGVFVTGSARITAGGAAAVTVTGTGGAGTGADNYGVFVVGTAAQITAAGGPVTVAGTGGTAGTNGIGVVVGTGGAIASPAALTVTGTRGAGTTAGIAVVAGTVSAVGLATLTGASGSDVLVAAAATANFGSLTFNTTAAVNVTEDSQTDLAGSSTANSLALTSAGLLTNAAAASLVVVNNASLAGTSIDLGNQATDTMNFGTLTFNSGGTVTIAEDSDTSLTGTSTANALTLASAGGVSNTAAASLTVTAAAGFSGTSVNLGNQTGDAMNFGTLAVSSTGAVNVSEDSDTAVVTVSGTTVQLTTTGAVFDANAAANNVTGTTLTVSAVTTVNLDTTVGTLNLSAGRDATIREADALVIGGVSVPGIYVFELSTAGAVTQTGAVTAGGFRLTGTGTTTLASTANDVITIAVSRDATTTFVDAGGLSVGTVTGLTGSTSGITLSAGNLTLTTLAAGLIVTSGVTAPGTVALTASDPVAATLTVAAAVSGGTMVTLATAAGNDSITVAAAGSVTGTNMVFVNGNDGNDTITLRGPVSGPSAYALGGAGTDTFVVSSSGPSTLHLDGQDGADTATVTVGTLDGTVAAEDSGTTGTDALTVQGTAQADTYDVNTLTSGDATVRVAGGGVSGGADAVSYTSGIEVMTLDGQAADDLYNVWFGQGGTSFLPPLTNLADTGATAGDRANVSGSDAADTIDVNFTAARTAKRGGESVAYTNGSLDLLYVYAKAGNDTVSAKAVPLTGGGPVVHLDGGLPQAPTTLPGDILVLDVTGMTGLNTATITTPDGSLPSSSHNLLDWVSFETIPVPIGLGGTFDFGTAASPVQAGPYAPYWTRVTGGSVYPTAGYYGWDAAVNDYDRGSYASQLAASDFRGVLEDGNWYGPLNVARTFSVAAVASGQYQVSFTLGDTEVVMDNIVVTVEGGGGPVAVPTAYQNQFVTLTTRGSDANGDGKLDVTFVDTEGTHLYWHVNAVDVRPVNLVSPVTITRYAGGAAVGPATLDADGQTATTYRASGFFPNAVVTVTATGNAKLVGVNPAGTADAADADPFLVGLQVRADANGVAYYRLVSPTGNAPVGMTAAAAIVADAAGTYTQTFALPAARKLDFNAAGSTGPTAAGYLGFTPDLYTGPAGNGLGWLQPVQSADRGAAYGGDLFGDFHYGLIGSPGELVIDVPSNAPQAVTFYLGDLYAPPDEVTVEYYNGTAYVPLAAHVTAAQVPSLTVTVTPVQLGATTNYQMRFRISDVAGPQNGWKVQGVEYRPASTQQTLTVTAAAVAPPAAVPGDGTTVTTYTVSGGPASGLVTVFADYGTFTGVDASPVYDGFQVQMTGGTGTFAVRSPVVAAGTFNAPVRLVAVDGAYAGGFTQAYTGAQVRYDFGPAGSPAVAAGFKGVSGTDVFSTRTGYGFAAAASDFDRDPARYTNVPAANPNLYRDGANGYPVGVYKVLVDSTLAAIPVTVYAFDADTPRGDVTVSVEGGGSPQTLPTTTDTPAVFNLVGKDANGDGVLDVSVSAFSFWTMNGIVIGTAPLRAAGGSAGAGDALTGDALAAVAAEAVRRWTMLDLTPAQRAALGAVTVTTADLDAVGRLGEAGGTRVTIDDDANGAGWFIDPTPADDAEFAFNGVALTGVGDAAGRYDLLTVVTHELGHVLGLDHAAAGLMDATLPAGVRRLPDEDDLVELVVAPPDAAVLPPAAEPLTPPAAALSGPGSVVLFGVVVDAVADKPKAAATPTAGNNRVALKPHADDFGDDV